MDKEMVTIHSCPKCSKIFATKRNLQAHLKRKFSCDQGEFTCPTCFQKFAFRQGRDYHRKYVCQGPDTLVIPEVEAAKQRIRELEEQLKQVTETIDEAEQDVEEDVEEETNEPSWIRPADFNPASIIGCDAEEPQLYFFQVTGDLLLPMVKTFGVPIKTGSSNTPYNRTLTHARDFGGGKLIDSVKTSNPRVVEAKFKRWMRATARFVDCKTPRKPGVEQEVFAAHCQEDYAFIVNKAKEFAEDYKNTIQTQNGLVNQLKAVLNTLQPLVETE